MKNFIIFFLLILPVHKVLSQEIEYKSDKYGYSLILPEIWEQVPQDLLIERTKQVSELMGKDIVYDAAFVLKGNKPFAAPFILIQYINANSGNFEEYVKGIEEGKEIKELSDDMMEHSLLTSFDVNSTYVDRTNKIIFQNITARSGGTVINGTSAIMLGGNEIVQVMFYDTEEGYGESIYKFFSVLKSFEYVKQ